MRTLFLIFALLTIVISTAASATTIPQDKSAATIIAYHRIDEDLFPDTNLKFEQFQAHINHIVNNGYNVQPLGQIIRDIKAGKELPPHTMAITFEGAYKSVLNNAIPLLKSHDLPFTIFYASNLASANTGQYMNWDDLESIANYKHAEFGILPASYTRLKNSDKETILRNLNNARIEYRKHFEAEPTLFSYPFGEWSLHFKNIIKSQNFEAALGLHSGVLHKDNDFYTLPRFSITENYGDLERFQLITNARPLPLTEIEPEDPALTSPSTLSSIGFTIDPSLTKEIDKLSCFISGHEKPLLEIIGDNRVELRPKNITQEEERIRVNCTLPINQTTWRWMGMLLTHTPRGHEETTPAPNNLAKGEPLPPRE